MNEVWQARSGTVARGRARGRVRQRLETLPDPPSPQGRIYPLACLVAIAALKDAGYLHIPEGRRDHTTPAETLRLHGLD